MSGIRPLIGNSLNKIGKFLGKKAKKNYYKNDIL